MTNLIGVVYILFTTNVVEIPVETSVTMTNSPGGLKRTEEVLIKKEISTITENWIVDVTYKGKALQKTNSYTTLSVRYLKKEWVEIPYNECIWITNNRYVGIITATNNSWGWSNER